MRIAYIVLAHKLPQQVVRLVERLDDPDAFFCLHVDANSPRDVHDRIRAGTAHLGSRRRMLRRHRCQWADFGIVSAALEGLRAAVAERADTAVLLSGQTYPIKPRERIREFLLRGAGHTFIDHNPLPLAHWPDEGGLERFRYRSARLGPWERRLPDRSPWHLLPLGRVVPGRLRPHVGGTWWAMDSEAARYVSAFAERHPRFLRDYRVLAHPDETFFQTVLCNSALVGSLVDDDLHYEDWSANGPHPETLSDRHFEAMRTDAALFARKCDHSLHPGLLDRIDSELLRA